MISLKVGIDLPTLTVHHHLKVLFLSLCLLNNPTWSAVKTPWDMVLLRKRCFSLLLQLPWQSVLHYSLTVRNEERGDSSGRPPHTTKMESIQVLEEWWVLGQGESVLCLKATYVHPVPEHHLSVVLSQMVLWNEKRLSLKGLFCDCNDFSLGFQADTLSQMIFLC